MTSRKYEKASNLSNHPSSTFWKKSSISGIPGRPNLNGRLGVVQRVNTNSSPVSSVVQTSSSSSSSPSKMPTSFRAFEASVSDAWDAQADMNFSAPMTTQGTTIQVRETSSSMTSTSLQNGLPSAERVNAPAPTRRETSTNPADTESKTGCSTKVEKIEKFFASDNVDLETLRKLSWSGLDPKVRSKVWKILCGYLPATTVRQEEVLLRKQEEYCQYVTQYFQTKDQDIHQDTYRQIHIDIPRMSPVISLFQQRCVQEIFERILYIWAIRHPASGYVQGINDLVTPFFLVFLQDYCQGSEIADIDVGQSLSEKDIQSIEADSFWCLTKVLDGIQDNYTFAQPGIQLKVKQLEELVQRIDIELHNHLTGHEVLYLQFAFRWMNNILMRELPIKATIRLWDTYLSEIEGFSHFHLYVCAAFLIHWKSELLARTDFHTLLMFLQNLPTAKWGDREINLLVAEAFKLSYLFADAPKHLNSSNSAQSSKK